MAGFFKHKKMERLEELFDALDTDEPGEAVHYTLLFEDDNELNQGMLAETLKSQRLTERLEMMQVAGIAGLKGRGVEKVGEN